jgi:hypothetical protein
MTFITAPLERFSAAREIDACAISQIHHAPAALHP